jgi:pimeloyl-ACP methyl ester carboxylesterase
MAPFHALPWLLAGCLACFAASPQPMSVPAGAKAGALLLRPAEFQTPEGRRYAGDRGLLVVPENRQVHSRLIALPVVRIRTGCAHPGEPVFLLRGGPGASNITKGKIYSDVEGLLATRDFVMVGYRGVDGSVVLDCPEVSAAMKGKGGDLLGAESLANLAQAMAAARTRLESTGVDLRGYSVPEVAEDLDAARAALGYPRLDFWSMSYGTRVALIYAQLHPERVRRSLMVGANPPGHFIWDPRTIDAQIERYARLWAQDPERARRCPDLAGTMRRVAHHMPRHWFGLAIDPGKVRVVTFAMLYERASAATVIDAYVAADHGDASGLALMSRLCDRVVPRSVVWGEAFCKGMVDRDPGRNYVAEMDPPEAILGSPTSLLFFGPITGSNPWPDPPVPAALRRVQPSAVETLVLSGNLDFSTPAEAATTDLLPCLSQGQQIVLSELGHINDLQGNQDEAFEKLMRDFFATGKADASGFHHVPMDFHVKWRLGTLAKLALGAGLGLILLVAGLAVLGWRFLRRWRRGDH